MKQPADSYFISGEPQGFGWARVFIQEGERTPDHRWGYLSIVSDYGNFGYFWSHIGCRSFREFLASLEFSYAMEKLRGEAWKQFDLDASLRYARREIVRARREGNIKRNEARRLFDDTGDILLEGRLSGEGWGNALQEVLGKQWDRWNAWEWCCQKVPSPDCLALWKHVWPKLLAEFAAERVSNPPAPQAVQPYINRHGQPVGPLNAPLVRWWEGAVALHQQAINAMSEHHYGEAAQCGVKLRNHLQSIPVVIPPGWELVRKADSNALPSPEQP